jgi:hypothetical protein
MSPGTVWIILFKCLGKNVEEGWIGCGARVP